MILDLLKGVLFQRDSGYDEDSKPVYFSKGRPEQNRKTLGQLKTVHENNLSLTSAAAINRYDGVKRPTSRSGSSKTEQSRKPHGISVGLFPARFRRIGEGVDG